MESPTNVTRIDIEPTETRSATHGWQVRIRRNGKRHTKFFSDNRYEGRARALEAAVAYRDELLGELPAPDPTTRRAWSNTGVIGISVRDKESRKGTGYKTYVQLSWIDGEGRRRGASYSVGKWGLRRALWNACLRRYKAHQDAERPTEEPHITFARAQHHMREEIAAEARQLQLAQREAAEAARRAEAEQAFATKHEGDLVTLAEKQADREDWNEALAPERIARHGDKIQEHLEKALFG